MPFQGIDKAVFSVTVNACNWANAELSAFLAGLCDGVVFRQDLCPDALAMPISMVCFPLRAIEVIVGLFSPTQVPQTWMPRIYRAITNNKSNRFRKDIRRPMRYTELDCSSDRAQLLTRFSASGPPPDLAIDHLLPAHVAEKLRNMEGWQEILAHTISCV